MSEIARQFVLTIGSSAELSILAKATSILVLALLAVVDVAARIPRRFAPWYLRQRSAS
jgi:hypothetical protein